MLFFFLAFQQMLNVELVKYLNAISQVYHAHLNTLIHKEICTYIQRRIYRAYTGTCTSKFQKKCTPTLKKYLTITIKYPRYSTAGIKTHSDMCRLWVLVINVVGVVIFG